MQEIKLKKRYPNVSSEDFTAIFYEGLLYGLKSAGKKAIPIERIKEYMLENWDEHSAQGYAIRKMLTDWEEENAKID